MVGSLVSSSLLHKVVKNWILKICLGSIQVHDEREMDRVLGIEGIELIGINNRSLGMLFFNFIKIDLLVELRILVLSLTLLSIFISWLRIDLPILAYWQFLFFLIPQKRLRLILVTPRNFLKESVVK